MFFSRLGFLPFLFRMGSHKFNASRFTQVLHIPGLGDSGGKPWFRRESKNPYIRTTHSRTPLPPLPRGSRLSQVSTLSPTKNFILSSQRRQANVISRHKRDKSDHSSFDISTRQTVGKSEYILYNIHLFTERTSPQN